VWSFGTQPVKVRSPQRIAWILDTAAKIMTPVFSKKSMTSFKKKKKSITLTKKVGGQN
jgi:hypothetical protein